MIFERQGPVSPLFVDICVQNIISEANGVIKYTLMERDMRSNTLYRSIEALS